MLIEKRLDRNQSLGKTSEINNLFAQRLTMEETRNAPYFNGEDRISKLQDELIHYVMSFMDTRYAVQTSVLSKRWIDIWKSLPFLSFDRSSFSEDKKDIFIKFVDMVFIFHQDFDIQMFTLLWMNSAYDNTVTMNVNRWMVHAVKHNVQRIRIRITQCHASPYEISHYLLNCKSLRTLQVQVLGNARYIDIVLPRSINLPQLKVLCLAGLSISNVSSNRLFLSCPVLRKLRIIDCGIKTDNQGNWDVDSPSLKDFGYDNRHKRSFPQKDTMANSIRLCAPNLEVFAFKSVFTQDYSLENCSPLSRVHFHMKLRRKEEHENIEAYTKMSLEEKDVYTKRIMKFLGAVYMTKEMTLSSGFLEVLSRAPDSVDCQPPRLCSLQSLTLEVWSTRSCFRAIAYLLSISPNITKVFLQSKKSNLADVGDDWEAGLSMIGVLSHLEYVKIEEVEGCDAEIKLLSFLLKNAKVLKKVVLYFRPSVGSPDRVSQIKKFRDKLVAVPRASSSTQMVLN